MLKYRLDTVSPDQKGSVVYVKLYDDAAPDVILTSLCVPYDDAKQFEAALEARTSKYLSSVAQKDALESLAMASFGTVETKINEVKK